MSIQEMAKIMRPGLCKIVEENEMNNGALLRAAHKYNNVELMEYCTEYLKRNVSVENAMDILVSAHLTDQKDLFDVVSKFALKNSGKLVQTASWEELMKINPIMAYHIMKSIVFI